jgi:hypothetical protein
MLSPRRGTQNVHGAVAVYEGVGMSAYRRYDAFDIGTSEAAEQTGARWLRQVRRRTQSGEGEHHGRRHR